MRFEGEYVTPLNPNVLLTFFGVIELLTIAVAIYIFRLRELDHQRTVGNLNQMLDRRNEEYESVLDRLHATRNLPPGKVDLTNEFEKRKEKAALREVARTNGGPIAVPNAIGPYDSAVLQMEMDAKRGRSQAV